MENKLLVLVWSKLYSIWCLTESLTTHNLHEHVSAPLKLNRRDEMEYLFPERFYCNVGNNWSQIWQ